MGTIYKNLNPEDVAVRSYQVHKEFTFNHTDSGSGVYGIRAIIGSTGLSNTTSSYGLVTSSVYNFQKSTANSQSFGEYNSFSASIDKDPYPATFYEIPMYYTIHNLFYRGVDVLDASEVNLSHWQQASSSRTAIISGSDDGPFNFSSRILHKSASIISISRQFYGEKIKPKSVTITDNSTDITYTLKDDGLGNLYDNNYSSSFTIASESYKEGGGGQVTGSIIGNVMYSHGLIVITDTGSYKDVGNTFSEDDGWEVTFKSTQTIYEREINCNVGKTEFRLSKNVSLTPGNSGSYFIPANIFPENKSYSTAHLNLPVVWPASSSYKDEGYRGTGSLLDIASGSEFSPYISTIALFDDNNDMLATAKLAKPIKNDKELDINFVVRFDT
tara:strand:- start:60 stop:1217 length:1158 start_codon:yes stop_codon:yes gene_type:complete